METKELFLKTLFCCSACDGDIATEEVSLVKDLTKNKHIFDDINVEDTLNNYIKEINERGKAFLRNYLNEVGDSALSEDEQITLIDLAIKMIEADNIIQYSEVRFFKKIRNRLSVSDEAILEKSPNIEDYLLPDILPEDKDFEEVGNFAPISLGN